MGDPSNKDRADTRNKEPDSHIQTSGGKRRYNTHRHSRSRNTNGDTLRDMLLGHQPYRRTALRSLAPNAVRTAPPSVTPLRRVPMSLITGGLRAMPGRLARLHKADTFLMFCNTQLYLLADRPLTALWLLI